MHVDKIVALLQKRPDGRLGLALVVGVKGTVGALHGNVGHPGAHGDSFQKVHRGDHGSLFSVFLLEGVQGRPGSGSPEPQRIGLVKAAPFAVYVHRMFIQNLIASLHHVPQHRVLRQILSDGLSQDVVRRRQLLHAAL